MGWVAGNDGLLGMLGNYTATDGSEQQMVDVWFAKQGAAPAPALNELLVADAGHLLAEPAEPAAKAADKTASAGMGSMLRTGLSDDEVLRQQSLLF